MEHDEVRCITGLASTVSTWTNTLTAVRNCLNSVATTGQADRSV